MSLRNILVEKKNHYLLCKNVLTIVWVPELHIY